MTKTRQHETTREWEKWSSPRHVRYDSFADRNTSNHRNTSYYFSSFMAKPSGIHSVVIQLTKDFIKLITIGIYIKWCYRAVGVHQSSLWFWSNANTDFVNNIDMLSQTDGRRQPRVQNGYRCRTRTDWQSTECKKKKYNI